MANQWRLRFPRVIYPYWRPTNEGFASQTGIRQGCALSANHFSHRYLINGESMDGSLPKGEYDKVVHIFFLKMNQEEELPIILKKRWKSILDKNNNREKVVRTRQMKVIRTRHTFLSSGQLIIINDLSICLRHALQGDHLFGINYPIHSLMFFWWLNHL